MAMISPSEVLFRGCLIVGLGSVFFAVGCGSDGPSRYHLSGKVTYGGQPIPAGSVTFLPDVSKGNSGPAASVDIQDGAYDTREQGVGHVGGPHTVRITALDGKSSDEFPKGVPMFPDFEMQLDLPKEDSTKDLEVPADWVPPPQQRGPVQPTA